MSANQGTSMPIAASHSHGPFGLQPGGYQVMVGMGGMPTTMGGVAGSMAMGNSFGGIPNAVAPAPPAPPMTLPGKQGSHFLAAPPLMMHARPPPPPLPPQQRPNIAPSLSNDTHRVWEAQVLPFHRTSLQQALVTQTTMPVAGQSMSRRRVVPDIGTIAPLVLAHTKSHCV